MLSSYLCCNKRQDLIYHHFFIHSSVHREYFQILAIVMNIDFNISFYNTIFYSSDRFMGIELLDHMIIRFYFFVILFFIEAEPVSDSEWGLPFFCIPVRTGCFWTGCLFVCLFIYSEEERTNRGWAIPAMKCKFSMFNQPPMKILHCSYFPIIFSLFLPYLCVILSICHRYILY